MHKLSVWGHFSIGVCFRVPYLESGTKVYIILNVDTAMPWEDVNEEILLSAHLFECVPSKRPTIFFRLSSSKQLTYSLTKLADWEFMIKKYRKEIAKKGEDAAVEISFPDKVHLVFTYLIKIIFINILVSWEISSIEKIPRQQKKASDATTRKQKIIENFFDDLDVQLLDEENVADAKVGYKPTYQQAEHLLLKRLHSCMSKDCNGKKKLCYQ